MKRARQNAKSGINPNYNSYNNNNAATPNLSEPLGLKMKHQDHKEHRSPTAKKRKLQFGQSPNLDGNQGTRMFEHFRRLDPSNPVEAKRMNTRQKQILKGKNTIGYDEYVRKVPKDKRKKILEHPSTPDWKADIPNRRWLGLVKAWRISLHQFDPKDLKSDLDSELKAKCGVNSEESNSKNNNGKATPTLQPKPRSVKDEQIAHASSQGLQVDFVGIDTSTDTGTNTSLQNNSTDFVDKTSEDDKSYTNELWLGKWEANKVGNEEELLLDYEDSDNELL
mmetsp:Transcript_19005/g.23943  ORF Transcript_19005/g.23943 Transcript_19005/m.23943 type:complete len:279 (-) Transcript_19005:100-936(-)|eukprot:CAMPEP_0203707568 /NCGR_PEP_ID=MMETSP0091-20130426/56167_1 /ASSEMBLY_ACC=CAM_ASM_001089 /TAXON_ID=426623 /ORGANISM="Chaetoceros affinis, Strain CCMP159" /LENGTH=278 /DNA_ID=CAMNT_0050583795 /DNA_START=24 /DNA_END=860 /DNA_ORIENTATION=-